MPPRARTRRPSGQPQLPPDGMEEVYRAVKEFEKIRLELQRFARSLTGIPTIRIHVTDKGPHSIGHDIYLRPPMALGRAYGHDRGFCGKRDGATAKQICLACRAREAVNFYLYHEIAHVWCGTQDKATRDDLYQWRSLVDEWHPQGACDHADSIARELAKLALRNNDKVEVMVMMNVFDPILGFLFNAIEDVRVNESMFRGFAGLRNIFNTHMKVLLEYGTVDEDSNARTWADGSPDEQFIIGLLHTAGGQDIDGFLHPKVVEEMKLDSITSTIERIREAKSVHDSLSITLEAFRVGQDLGYFNIPKCVPPPAPEDEPEDLEPGQEGSDPSEEVADGGESSDEEGDPGSASGGSGDSSSDLVPAGGDNERPEASEVGPRADDSSGTPESGPQQDGSLDVSESDVRSGQDDRESPLGEPEVEGEVPDGVEGSPGKQEDDNSSGEPGDDGDLGGPSGSDSPDAPGDPAGGDDQGPDVEADEADDTGGDREGPEADNPTGGGPESPGGSDQLDDGLAPMGASSTSGKGSASPDAANAQAGTEGDSESEQDSASLGDGDGGRQEVSGDDGSPEDPESEQEGALDEGEPDGVPDQSDTSDVWDVVAPPQEPMPEFAPTHQVARDLQQFMLHGDDHGSGILQDLAGQELPDIFKDLDPDGIDFAVIGAMILNALRQVVAFDTSSANVAGVEIATFPSRALQWHAGHDWSLYSSPESILGAAIMRARLAFMENRMTKVSRNQRSGKIVTRMLGKRAPLGDDRLFGKKELPKKRSYFVVIGADMSASTWEFNRNKKIKRLMMAQGDILHRLGIPFVMYGHSAARHTIAKHEKDRYGGGDFYVYMLPIKTERDPWNAETKAKIAGMHPISDNLDGHTLEFYRKIAEKSNATDPIIIYFTDGEMPAANFMEERDLLVRETGICVKKNIHLLGVGINTDSPKQYGMNTVEVNKDEDISLVIKQLEMMLTQK